MNAVLVGFSVASRAVFGTEHHRSSAPSPAAIAATSAARARTERHRRGRRSFAGGVSAGGIAPSIAWGIVRFVRAIAIVNGNARRLRDRLRAKLSRALPGGVVF